MSQQSDVPADVPYDRRSDVSAKDASNVDFELAVECLINKLLHEEDIFEPGAR